MPAASPPISREELARLGEELFADRVAPHVQGEAPEKFVAIDVVTGAFAVDADERAATDRVRAKHPGAQVWLRRVGSRYARHYGARRA